MDCRTESSEGSYLNEVDLIGCSLLVGSFEPFSTWLPGESANNSLEGLFLSEIFVGEWMWEEIPENSTPRPSILGYGWQVRGRRGTVVGHVRQKGHSITFCHPLLELIPQEGPPLKKPTRKKLQRRGSSATEGWRQEGPQDCSCG